jgi:osmotically inducible protein OsmC
MGIVRIDLDCVADVPGIGEKAFMEQAEGAKKGCPISKALAAVPEITLKVKLVR